MESLVRTRRAPYETLAFFWNPTHPRHVRTQIPHIHNEIVPGYVDKRRVLSGWAGF
jgi:hypothetical protein